MQLTFEPEALKPKDGQAPAYAGTVTLNMLSYDERMELLEGYSAENGVDVAAAAEESDEKSKKTGMKLVRYVAKRAKDRVGAVAIKRLEDGFEFKTFDDLNYDSDMVGVITEISTKLIGKFQVGKTSKPS